MHPKVPQSSTLFCLSDPSVEPLDMNPSADISPTRHIIQHLSVSEGICHNHHVARSDSLDPSRYRAPYLAPCYLKNLP